MASKGLFATGVSTDLNGLLSLNMTVGAYIDDDPVTYLNSGGRIGDIIRAVSRERLMIKTTADKGYRKSHVINV